MFEVLRVIESKSTTKQEFAKSKSTLGDPGAIKFRARGKKIGVKARRILADEWAEKFFVLFCPKKDKTKKEIQREKF